ncbi:MAG: glycine cleavage system aminomethyltransferase GcvT [Deltaproteobacteria bacterium]|nr:glycine cleavage system aminomethyltransferase GcvT [Deltaproteobacteria bacterium]MBW2393161.1 glycine cleavage system aminomethyltransferase GcvT [Deltaproteobacteria bacterium]
MTGLQRTPLHEAHIALGARMVPFAGFDMPVQYDSIKEEHAAVRQTAGLFDVSHMGQIHFAGPEAVATVERLLTCHVASLRVGRVRYGLLCNEEGGVVDDVTVYRTGEDSLFLCVNAANVEKDYRWCVRHASEAAGVRNRSAETALLALQGPDSATILAKLGAVALDEMRRFRFADAELAGGKVVLSRTGYTGSDGFEIYAPAGAAMGLWQALTDAGARPCGLGARDTLRLEAALPLYGHELDDSTSPIEARLDRFVKFEAGGFIGAEAVRRCAKAGPKRLLAGFEMVGRGIARAGYPIAKEGETVGAVTSGGPSPTLGKSIGLGYVPPALAEPGQGFDIVVRGKPVAARVIETPFVH